MKKKIIIEVETEEDNGRIVDFTLEWVKKSFQKYKGAEVEVQDG